MKPDQSIIIIVILCWTSVKGDFSLGQVDRNITQSIKDTYQMTKSRGFHLVRHLVNNHTRDLQGSL